MLGSDEDAMVDAVVETATVPPLGCRTLCQHPGCGVPIEEMPPTFPGGNPFWSHIEPVPAGRPRHPATPVEQPEVAEPSELVPAGPWTRGRMLREIADLVDGGLPAPYRITLWQFTSGGTEVEMHFGATGDVDAWAAWAGLTGGRGELLTAPGQPSWRNYEAKGEAPWPGWGRVDVSCHVAAEVPQRRLCPECKADVDNHYPCGEPGCGCWCGDPDTPADMLRPPGGAR
jgi:hypothetical protein